MGLGRKAERSRRTDQVQGEEFVCITDRLSWAAVNLVNTLCLEINEVRHLQ